MQLNSPDFSPEYPKAFPSIQATVPDVSNEDMKILIQVPREVAVQRHAWDSHLPHLHSHQVPASKVSAKKLIKLVRDTSRSVDFLSSIARLSKPGFYAFPASSLSISPYRGGVSRNVNFRSSIPRGNSIPERRRAHCENVETFRDGQQCPAAIKGIPLRGTS